MDTSNELESFCKGLQALNIVQNDRISANQEKRAKNGKSLAVRSILGILSWKNYQTMAIAICTIYLGKIFLRALLSLIFIYFTLKFYLIFP